MSNNPYEQIEPQDFDWAQDLIDAYETLHSGIEMLKTVHSDLNIPEPAWMAEAYKTLDEIASFADLSDDAEEDIDEDEDLPDFGDYGDEEEEVEELPFSDESEIGRYEEADDPVSD